LSHPYLRDARFYAFLLQIDLEAAGRVRDAGCPCGGTLHSAKFPRRPRVRGVSLSELGVDYTKRLSFCCAVDGCRARATPPSVRFLGRRWYLGALVLLAGMLSQGLDYARGKGICHLLRVPWRTLERWREWWQETLPRTRFWRGTGRRLSPPVAAEALPSALIKRFRGSEEQRLVAALRWLAPITTTSA
jgi:hypothetical protein